jgi:uncharacterized protein YjbI with pentapeptide repeats
MPPAGDRDSLYTARGHGGSGDQLGRSLACARPSPYRPRGREAADRSRMKRTPHSSRGCAGRTRRGVQADGPGVCCAGLARPRMRGDPNVVDQDGDLIWRGPQRHRLAVKAPRHRVQQAAEQDVTVAVHRAAPAAVVRRTRRPRWRRGGRGLELDRPALNGDRLSSMSADSPKTAELTVNLELKPDWIKQIAQQYAIIRKNKDAELDKISNVFGNPEILSRLYVEPECELENPADVDEESPIAVFRKPVKDYLNHFLGQDYRERDGRNQLFILADAGMGKTSLLTMLKIASLSLLKKRSGSVYLEKLGGETLDRLARITSRRDALLLLDSLDEDPASWGRIEERIQEILDETKTFSHVIITCRTQFFPSMSEKPIECKGRISIGEFKCPLIYLSPFTNTQVQEYLDKRYLQRPQPNKRRSRLLNLFAIFRAPAPPDPFSDEASDCEAREKIERVVTSMRTLQFRPMLLAYADDLKDASEPFTAYHIYEIMIKRWLAREVLEKPLPSGVSSDDLFDGFAIMAAHLSQVGRRHLTEDELRKIIEHPGLVARIGLINFGGRSLLNKNSSGDFRFSHYSIQEFLLANLILRGKRTTKNLRVTRQVVDFMVEGVSTKRRLNLQGADLSGENLSGLNLVGINLAQALLRETKLDQADLSQADLTNAVATHASLKGAILHGATLDGATFERAALPGAKFDRTSVVDTNFSRADLSDVGLSSEDLHSWNDSRMRLSGAIIARSNVGDLANLRALVATKPENERIQLIELRGERVGKVYSFNYDVIKIGKLKSNHLVLLGEDAARMHAVIEISGGDVRIIDLGSAAGSIVNGTRIDKSQMLHDGDVLEFSEQRFLVKL